MKILAHSPNTLKENKVWQNSIFLKNLILNLGYNHIVKISSQATVPLRPYLPLEKKVDGNSKAKLGTIGDYSIYEQQMYRSTLSVIGSGYIRTVDNPPQPTNTEVIYDMLKWSRGKAH
jgi:hypothetical protein